MKVTYTEQFPGALFIMLYKRIWLLDLETGLNRISKQLTDDFPWSCLLLPFKNLKLTFVFSNICRGLYLGGLIMVPSEGSFGSILLTSNFVLSRFMWATRNMSSKRWRVNLISWINWLSLARSSSRTLFNNNSVSIKYTDLAWINHLFLKRDTKKLHRKINIDYNCTRVLSFYQELYRTVEFRSQQSWQ